MIRGYVVVQPRYWPLPDIPSLTALYRKTAVKLSTSTTHERGKDIYEFFISVEGNEDSFQVVYNIREVDKEGIDGGLVRISFVRPPRDIFISCSPRDLKAFVSTVEAVKRLREPGFIHNKRDCPSCYCFSTRPESCFHDLLCNCPYGDDYMQRLKFTISCHGWWSRLIASSYPYLMVLKATALGLREIPEEFGSLPCLIRLNLSSNHLGVAPNWNWLMSPFIRENLCELHLDRNEICSFPEAILGLKNLETLSLNSNHLMDLPAALGKLKKLRYLHIENNRLEILPASMLRKQRLSKLTAKRNKLHENYYIQQRDLFPEDFETVSIQSLFKIVTKYIITNRLDFWQYNIPTTLADYLEGDYRCRCGSVVLRDDTSPVDKRCCIPTRLVAESFDLSIIPIVFHCCSYECYNLIRSMFRSFHSSCHSST